MTCGGCGDKFELSLRREYAHRVEGKEPRCLLCRRPPRPLTDEERERFTRWWLAESGLSARELHEVAVGLS